MTTLSHLVGLLLQNAFALAAAFTPYVILIICIIGLLMLACVPGWMREAKLLDEALNNFDTPSGDTEKQPLIKDPMVSGSDDTTKSGGGLVHHRPPSQNFNTRKIQNQETKCVSAGSGVGASRVGKT
jgi:hypothetical protein